MGFPLLPPISSAGKLSARARLMVALAGAAPTRTATMVPLKSPAAAFPLAALAARSSGGGLGDGEAREGGARLVGEGIYTALHRPAASKKPIFPSSGGIVVLCLPRGAGGDNNGDGGEGSGGVGSGGDNNGAGGLGAGGEGAGGNNNEGDGVGTGGNPRSWWEALYTLMKQILVTQVVQALILFVVYKVSYDKIYNYVYYVIKKLLVSYMEDDEFNEMLYNYLFALFKKLGLSYLEDKEFKKSTSEVVDYIAYPWFYRLLYCAMGITVVLIIRSCTSRKK